MKIISKRESDDKVVVKTTKKDGVLKRAVKRVSRKVKAKEEEVAVAETAVVAPELPPPTPELPKMPARQPLVACRPQVCSNNAGSVRRLCARNFKLV